MPDYELHCQFPSFPTDRGITISGQKCLPAAAAVWCMHTVDILHSHWLIFILLVGGKRERERGILLI